MGKQPYGSQESYSLVLFMSDLLQSKGTVKTPLGKWLLHQMMSLLKESSLTESTIFILNVHRLNFLMMFDSMSTRSINMAKQLFLFLANRSDKVIDSQGKLFHSSLGLFDRAVKHLESEESSSKRLSQWELFTYVKWSRDFCQQKIDRLPALSLPS
ncbi:MAG TPA: hypothetical protein DCL40_02525 [Coxiellaceae bacterium]|nr:hypothetical protein [Coxiellaceae bacterium]